MYQILRDEDMVHIKGLEGIWLYELCMPWIDVYLHSMNWVNIGSGNGLPPVQGQDITSANAFLFSVGSLQINFNEIMGIISIKILQYDTFKNVITEL